MKIKAATWFLVLVLLAGFGLRLYGLGRHPLWIDEALTWHISTRPDVLEALRGPSQHSEPPLIHMLVHPVRIFTGAPAILRIVPALFGCFALLLWWRLLMNWLPLRGTLAGVALLSFSAFHVYYCQELRSYAVTFALSLILLAIYLEWLRVGYLKTYLWVCMGITKALIVYSHYLAGLFPLALAMTIPFVRVYRRSLRPWLLSLALAVLLFAPWLGDAIRCVNIVHQAGIVKDYNILRDTVAPFLILPLGKTLIPNPAHTAYWLELVAVLVPGAIMFFLMVMASLSLLKEGKRELWFILTMSIVIPVVVLNLYSVLIHVNYNYKLVKYLFFIYPPCLLLSLISLNSRRWKTIILAAVLPWLAVNFWALYIYHFDPEYWKDCDYPAAVRLLEKNAQPGELITCTAEFVALPFQCYLLQSETIRNNPFGVIETLREYPTVRRYARTESFWELLPRREERPESFWVLLFVGLQRLGDTGWEVPRRRWNRHLAECVASGTYALEASYTVRGLEIYHLVRQKK